MSNEIEVPPYHPRPPGPLVKISGIRKELAALYRDARLNKVNTDKAAKLTYILATLARIIQGDELERRLEQLESEVHNAGGGRIILYDVHSEVIED